MRKREIQAEELLRHVNSFTSAQRNARESFAGYQMHLPREWLLVETVDGCEMDADAGSRVATAIYNSVVESGRCDPRFADQETWEITTSFASLVREGGDAHLWVLIRIGVDEAAHKDLAGLCEDRGYMVR